jgi:hypothetical protein
MRHSQPAVLPIAFVALRILVIVNWVAGACILALLAVTFLNDHGR